MESTTGQGTRFSAEIPCERAQASEPHRGSDLERLKVLADGRPEYRVLIVEDQ